MDGTGFIAAPLMRLRRGVAGARRAGDWDRSAARDAFVVVSVLWVGATAGFSGLTGRGSTPHMDDVPCHADAHLVAHPGAWPRGGSSSGESSIIALPAHVVYGVAD